MAPLHGEETFLPVGTAPGTLDRLIMNCAFRILLTHWDTISLQQGATSVVLVIYLFIYLNSFSLLEKVSWIAEHGDRSNEKWKGGVITRSIPLRMSEDECMGHSCRACWGVPFINHQLLWKYGRADWFIAILLKDLSEWQIRRGRKIHKNILVIISSSSGNIVTENNVPSLP